MTDIQISLVEVLERLISPHKKQAVIAQSFMNYARLNNLAFSICKDQINEGLWVFRNSCWFIYNLFHVIYNGKQLHQSACGTFSELVDVQVTHQY